jgi:hypothetical protein
MGKKKQSTPSKKLTKNSTANNMKEQLETLTKIINSRVEEYYEEPRFDKTIPLTKVIKELDTLEEDVFREGVDSNIAIGTKTGDDKHVFFWPEDILKFLADPHFYLSSKDIKWAFKEIYILDKGYKLVKVMLHMNVPPFDISIYTLCITEEGFDYLRKKFKVNSVRGKGEEPKGKGMQQTHPKGNLPEGLEYIRWDDNDEMFYAKAKGRTKERALKLAGQPYEILHCLFNEYDTNIQKASVPIDEVLCQARIKEHKRGDNISAHKKSQLHVKVKAVRDELKSANFDDGCIKVIGKHCELYINCSYHD